MEDTGIRCQPPAGEDAVRAAGVEAAEGRTEWSPERAVQAEPGKPVGANPGEGTPYST